MHVAAGSSVQALAQESEPQMRARNEFLERLNATRAAVKAIWPIDRPPDSPVTALWTCGPPSETEPGAVQPMAVPARTTHARDRDYP
jgi:hypothetical protein